MQTNKTHPHKKFTKTEQKQKGKAWSQLCVPSTLGHGICHGV